MKKTLILILVVLMALFAFAVISAYEGEIVTPVEPTDAEVTPAATEPVASDVTSEEPSDLEDPESGEQPEEMIQDEPEDISEKEIEVSDADSAADESDESATDEGADPATADATESATDESAAPAAPAEGTDPATADATESDTDESPAPAAPAEDTAPATTDTTESDTDESPAPAAPAEDTAPATTDTTESDTDESPAPATLDEVQTPVGTEDEVSVTDMIVTITGKQLTVKYDEADETIHTADGFTVDVTCTADGEPVDCPTFDEEKDLHFNGSDHAQRRGNEEGTSEMGLRSDQFELDLNADNVNVSIVVIDGFIMVERDYTEPEVIDQTEPEDEEENTDEGEPEENEISEQTASDDRIVFSNSCLTLRLIRTAEEPVIEENNAEETPEEETAEPGETDGEGNEPDELSEEPTDDESEADELNDETDGEVETDELTEETDEEKAELSDEENSEDELTEPTEGEEENAEDGEAEFQTVVSGDAPVEPVAEDGEVTLDEAETEETAPQSLTLTAGSMLYAGADAEGEALFTAEENLELTVISVDEETGWALVELPDGTQGYVLMPAEEEEEEEEKIPMIKEKTPVRISADGMSLVLYTTEGEMEVTILEVNDDWYRVELADGTVGYIFKKDMVNYEAPEEVIEKKVTIFSTIHPMMEVNEPITLTSYLEGFEDCVEITYQWECDKGNGFEPVEGANDDSYTYDATIESVAWNWQLVVNYK